VDELAALEGLVGRERLVTLVGPGGCGKTRLAMDFAGRGRVRGFVELAALGRVVLGDEARPGGRIQLAQLHALVEEAVHRMHEIPRALSGEAQGCAQGCAVQNLHT
jgi:hypothetical protein